VRLYKHIETYPMKNIYRFTPYMFYFPCEKQHTEKCRHIKINRLKIN